MNSAESSSLWRLSGRTLLLAILDNLDVKYLLLLRPKLFFYHNINNSVHIFYPIFLNLITEKQKHFETVSCFETHSKKSIFLKNKYNLFLNIIHLFRNFNSRKIAQNLQVDKETHT